MDGRRGDLRKGIASVRETGEFVYDMMWKKELFDIDGGIWEPDIYVSDAGRTGWGSID